MLLKFCFALLLALQLPAALSIEEIMRGHGLTGYAPRELRFSGDGTRIYFEWKQYSDSPNRPFDLWVVQSNGEGLRRLTPQEALSAPPLACAQQLKASACAYAQQGDIWHYDYRTDKALRLTHTGDTEAMPQLSRDGRRVFYQRSGNLFAHSLSDGSVAQLTNIRTANADDEAPKKEKSQRDILKEEEKSLLSIVAERAALAEEAKKLREAALPKALPLRGKQRIMALWITPDEEWILASISEEASAKTAIVPNYVSATGYTEDLNTRTKVGDELPKSRMVVIRRSSGEWKDIDSGIEKHPHRLLQPIFDEATSRIALTARAIDNKDRWILALDPAAARARELHRESSNAWVQGPQGFGVSFSADGSEVIFRSEHTGWMHLYAAPFAGGTLRAVTSGEWEVHNGWMSADSKTLYAITTESSYRDQQLWAIDVTSGKRQLLTREPGHHEATPARDGRSWADVWSRANVPPEIYLAGRKLTDSPAPEFRQQTWIDTPIVEVPARDGAKVPAHIYKPANWKRGGPAVIFVHGAGYLQNVHNGWSNYFREYMFHHYLMEQGFLVMDLDYRGSAGHGAAWRTAVYRHMGGKDLDDQVDAARWMAATHGVDPRRIGIYGGSYGGFITLMALFTQPDVFAAGAALRPVTDWAHYNHGYTSNILNTPQTDMEAYKRSSPIYHAAGLKGALLICHGMVDINVHYQDSVRLAQKLIELGKENWELAAYPVEDHGFVQPSSWTDEYRRIFKLFATHLKK
jgi:dipeptidyl aminopeptidase/acylaminoacyl peptidase